MLDTREPHYATGRLGRDRLPAVSSDLPARNDESSSSGGSVLIRYYTTVAPRSEALLAPFFCFGPRRRRTLVSASPAAECDRSGILSPPGVTNYPGEQWGRTQVRAADCDCRGKSVRGRGSLSAFMRSLGLVVRGGPPALVPGSSA